MVQTESDGRKSCGALRPGAYVTIALAFMNLLMEIVSLGGGLWLFCGLKRHGASLTNATGSTIFFGILTEPFLVIWTIYFIASPLSGLGHIRWLDLLSLQIGLTGVGILGPTAAMNLGLMWLQVAQSAKSLTKGSKNLSRKASIFVAIFAVVFGLMLCVLAVLRQFAIAGGLSTLFLLGIGLAYVCGARKLTQVIGSTGGNRKAPKIKLILKTAYRAAAAILFYVVIAVIFTVSDLMRSLGRPDGSGKPAVFPFINVLKQLGLFGLIFSVNMILSISLYYLKFATAVSRRVADANTVRKRLVFSAAAELGWLGACFCVARQLRGARKPCSVVLLWSLLYHLA